jgi:hypothetical protein
MLKKLMLLTTVLAGGLHPAGPVASTAGAGQTHAGQ